MKFDSKQLKQDLITKRCIDNDMSMDDACKEIGISRATLSRIERSRIPDLLTLIDLCEWLGVNPGKYFIS
jgi:transcriptional regulator with XRE-family HTH domain